MMRSRVEMMVNAVVLLRHGSRIFRRVLGSLWDIGNEEVLRRAYFQFVDETKDKIFVAIAVCVARLRR
ncbi:hypothetical protein D5086_019442 [Populus alba]|uniref:Uncharacterized protein n=1 Tax=Populus alba TaxID=43335 RepID=A0ACC4BIU6_POPAL